MSSDKTQLPSAQELTAELRARICKFLQAGASLENIAELIGVPPATLESWMAQDGFAAEVREAMATAKVAAEVAAQQKSLVAWLKQQRPRFRTLRKRRDLQIIWHIRRLRGLAPHLDRPEYLPLLRSYVRISMLAEEAFVRLKDADLMSDKTGELRTSLDTVRNLARTQYALAGQLGLTPVTAAQFRSEHALDIAAACAQAEDAEEE